jgi:hypothetical protein
MDIIGGNHVGRRSFMKKKRMLIALTSLLVVGIGVFFFTLPRASTRPDPSFAERLAVGVGTVVTVPAAQANVPGAVNVLADWIDERSGVALSQSNRNLLITYSQHVIGGARQELTSEQIQSAIKATFFEVVDKLSNQDLAVLRDRLRVHPDYRPPDIDQGVSVRSDGRSLPLSVWDNYAAEFRDGSTASAIAWRAMIGGFIEQEIDERLAMLSVLSEWSNRTTYTPLQAAFLFYSIVNEDNGNGPNSNLKPYMEHLANDWYPKNGVTGVVVGDRKAYGAKGFLYRSAADYFMSDSALSFFLTRLYE